MYTWLRKGLFLLPPESAHDLALNALCAGHPFGLSRLFAGPAPELPTSAFGVAFPNPVGLAAGLDKNGDHIDALGALGFGFIEVGTVTPEPQPGNPKPRMFRLPEFEALINRLGFNNKGVDHLVERLKRRRWKGVVGVNIGKQKTTPLAAAPADYRHCLERVHPHCDYITVNISSPNTENLRRLQDTGPLAELLAEITGARDAQSGPRRPVLLKIAPDWDDNALEASLEIIADSGIDGLIATNTTTDRKVLGDHSLARQAGGLSGAPLKRQADQVLAICHDVLGKDFPLIGLGGITRGQDAADKIGHGARLVQIYTGFIYHGPGLIRDCVEQVRGSRFEARGEKPRT